MSHQPCIIGLEQEESQKIKNAVGGRVLCHELLPKILVSCGELWVESVSGADMLPVSKVVFHGIFENDHDTISALALWGGPCLPNAIAMMDCRLKLPCLVKALQISQFGEPLRGFASPGVEFKTSHPHVAKWGNWHCGENKARFHTAYMPREAAIIEPFIQGSAIRVVVIGDQHWQIELAGDDWLKSIHHQDANIMPTDSALLDDTRNVAESLGLEIAANDYIVDAGGQPHLLEVNHIPNISRFPEIWHAYKNYVLEWLN